MSKTLTGKEWRVGSQDVEATGNYPPPDGKSTVTRSIMVHGPDNEAWVAGPGGPPAFTVSGGTPIMILHCKIECRKGTTKIGPYTDGIVQERIRRPQFQLDSGWVDASGDFYLDASKVINDIKKVDSTDPALDWANMQNGDLFDDFYQTNRLLIRDCHGVYRSFEFGEKHWAKAKDSATTWKLLEVIP